MIEASRRQRRIKIAATLGPSSKSKKIISELFKAGADVFRLNMSHSTHKEIGKLHTYIREIEAAANRPICIMADLQGPKLRCGVFANGSEELIEGENFSFDLDETPGTEKRVCLPHKEIFASLEVGSRLLVDDGKICLKVLSFTEKSAFTEILVAVSYTHLRAHET